MMIRCRYGTNKYYKKKTYSTCRMKEEKPTTLHLLFESTTSVHIRVFFDVAVCRHVIYSMNDEEKNENRFFSEHEKSTDCFFYF